MGFQNIGPNYWKGEQGRLALITGRAKFTDPDYVAVWRTLAKWRPYLASGFEAQKYPDSQNLFTLAKRPSTPPARGRSRCSTGRRNLRRAPSPRPCRPAPQHATSAIIQTSPWG